MPSSNDYLELVVTVCEQWSCSLHPFLISAEIKTERNKRPHLLNICSKPYAVKLKPKNRVLLLFTFLCSHLLVLYHYRGILAMKQGSAEERCELEGYKTSFHLNYNKGVQWWEVVILQGLVTADINHSDWLFCSGCIREVTLGTRDDETRKERTTWLIKEKDQVDLDSTISRFWN